jgi:hypothetical protein
VDQRCSSSGGAPAFKHKALSSNTSSTKKEKKKKEVKALVCHVMWVERAPWKVLDARLNCPENGSG